MRASKYVVAWSNGFKISEYLEEKLSPGQVQMNPGMVGLDAKNSMFRIQEPECHVVFVFNCIASKYWKGLILPALRGFAESMDYELSVREEWLSPSTWEHTVMFSLREDSG